MIAKGQFDITMNDEPPYDAVEEVTLGRVNAQKQYTGSLVATGQMQMLAARTPLKGSAGYSAVERISGALDGKQGSFIVVHAGVANRGKRSLLSITIVPDSGTGELRGISGKLDVQIIDGKHLYEIDYSLDN